jgi:DNA-directed RNA polymerase subunit RPC12/RpoP
MSFEAAKCPCCGANIQADATTQTTFCAYCGAKLITKAALAFYKIEVTGVVQLQAADFTIRGGVLEKYNGASTEVVVPASVVEIGKGAFQNCAVTRVTLPEGLKTIGYYAFRHCTALTEIALPGSLTEISPVSFWGTNISSIIIHSGQVYSLLCTYDSGAARGKHMFGDEWREHLKLGDEFSSEAQKKFAWWLFGRCFECGGNRTVLSGKCKDCGAKRVDVDTVFERLKAL